MKWLLTAAGKESPNLHHYLGWVHGAGVATTIIRPSHPLPPAAEFDALLLTGGGDIAPARYAQPAHPKTGGVQPDRDEMEFGLLGRFCLARKPVLGICRGLQIVQVAFGGRLMQHIPNLVKPADERHSQIGGRDSVHALAWRPKLPMAAALDGQATACNSSHHQAADPSALGQGLAIAATSACGIVEALEMAADDGRFVSCVQWHPERMEPDQPACAGLRSYWVEQVCRRAVGQLWPLREVRRPAHRHR
jgi:gamma-glutamyl-gamma-aminobutyrate hydrolase PuuD